MIIFSDTCESCGIVEVWDIQITDGVTVEHDHSDEFICDSCMDDSIALCKIAMAERAMLN